MGVVEAADGVVEGHGRDAKVNGITSFPQLGEGTREVVWWVGGRDSEREVDGVGIENGKDVDVGVLKGFEPRDEQ